MRIGRGTTNYSIRAGIAQIDGNDALSAYQIPATATGMIVFTRPDGTKFEVRATPDGSDLVYTPQVNAESLFDTVGRWTYRGIVRFDDGSELASYNQGLIWVT